ncbi:lytic transglycosylase domain-containing protein [Candidatus Dependentiae bacterium]|nr:lytic transglycosylase domain-containing protein [Candidatus Dependentiae bacterium]
MNYRNILNRVITLLLLFLFSNQVFGDVEKLEVPLDETVTNAIINIASDPVSKNYYEDVIFQRVKYLNFFKTIFKKNGIPEELVYLSVIESGLNPRAQSPAGAVGIWQFMRPTAEGLGLKVNFWIDERRDYIKSTRAAAIYLKGLYNSFGSWEYALAGYNLGGRKLKKAIREKVGEDNLQKLNIPRETKNFVTGFYAVFHIINNHKAFGFSGLNQNDKFRFETIEFNSVVDLKFIASNLGISVKTLRKLNPELKFGFTPPGKYLLIIPQKKKKLFYRNLKKVNIKKEMFEGSHIIFHLDTLIYFYNNYGVYKNFYHMILTNRNFFLRRKTLLISLLRDSHSEKRVNDAADLKQSEVASKLRDGDALKLEVRENILLKDIFIFFDE